MPHGPHIKEISGLSSCVHVMPQLKGCHCNQTKRHAFNHRIFLTHRTSVLKATTTVEIVVPLIANLMMPILILVAGLVAGGVYILY